ncbi:MAG: septal ring lytic transglycosylase RlpA family protein [Thainema sp.]
MSRKILSSVVAAIVVSTLATPLASQANTTSDTDAIRQTVEVEPEADPPSTPADGRLAVSVPREGSDQETVKVARSATKVGERHVEAAVESQVEAAIAQIQSHTMGDREAATLYVRGIPVFTFIGNEVDSESDVKVGETGAVAPTTQPNAESKNSPAEVLLTQATDQAVGDAVDSSDPVWKASELAARINQLHREGVDPTAIAVEWQEDDQYLITVSDQPLLEFGGDVILPDTTQDIAEDALQATNRLRRLLGGTESLSAIEGLPESRPTPSSVAFRASGMASWYGPGFHGNRSASGEIFDQNALTAAHRTLPFGTHVRVTNVQSGESVVVRINDRGPYSHGRVIDLSAGAARAIGLVRLGVAPVQLDVVEPTASGE